jgi:hypothetical protein
MRCSHALCMPPMFAAASSSSSSVCVLVRLCACERRTVVACACYHSPVLVSCAPDSIEGVTQAVGVRGLLVNTRGAIFARPAASRRHSSRSFCAVLLKCLIPVYVRCRLPTCTVRVPLDVNEIPRAGNGVFQFVSMRVFGTHEVLSDAPRGMLPSVVGRSAASVCCCCCGVSNAYECGARSCGAP